MIPKIDFKKTLPGYRATTAFEVITLPPQQYLMIDGHGDPNAGGPFSDAISALYPVAYTLKFTSKKELGRDYTVMPLEGLWSAADPSAFTTAPDKSTWDWTLMIMVPEWIDADAFAAARLTCQAKGKARPEVLDRIRLETLAEAECVQILHVGPFDAEAETLRRLHQEFIPSHGLRLTGRHHEIYLSDFTKVAPKKLRTILRQPVSPAG